MDSSRIAETLAPAGLIVRGGFHPRAEDAVPRPAATVVLIGNAGQAMWRAFTAAVGDPPPPVERHPLDGWIREVVSATAAILSARPLFPFDGPPHLPFLRWARQAGGVYASPIGMAIDPEYGLWHAYRAALVFAERLALPPADPRPSPCESCRDRPCLTTCPVGAFDSSGYDVAACAGLLHTPAGQDCMELGCRARRACPVGRGYRWLPAQARFHMQGFLAAR